MLKKIFSNKYVNMILLISVTALVLFLTLKDDFNNIVSNILTLNIWWFLVAILFMFGFWIYKTLAMQNIIRTLYPNYSTKKTFKLTLLTHFWNGITPFSTGGQPFLIYKLNKDGVRVTDATNIIVQNSIVYQIAIVLLSIIALISNAIFKIFPTDSLLNGLVTIGFIVNISVVVILYLVTFAKGAHKWLLKVGIKILTKLKIVKNPKKTKENWEEKIAQFNVNAKMLLKNKKNFIKSIIFYFIGIVAQYLIPLIILYSMGNYNAFNGLLSIVASTYVMLIGSFVPIPGGTGGIEYGFIKFFGSFISGSVLNTMMLLWRFVTFYLGLIIGAIFVNIKDKDEKK